MYTVYMVFKKLWLKFLEKVFILDGYKKKICKLKERKNRRKTNYLFSEYETIEILKLKKEAFNLNFAINCILQFVVLTFTGETIKM